MQFFELLQIAIGNRSQLSHTPTAEEWREICALAKKQAMVGIAFRGVEQLPVEQRPPRKLWMQWYTAAERIKGLNADMDRKVFKVARMFRREGFQGVVLKGQGMAQLYKVERSTVNSQRTDHPDGIIQHSTFNGNNLTQNSQNTQNISVNANIDTNLDTNSQKTHCFARVSHPGESFDLTQKVQKSQNLHDAAPVRLPDEVLSLTQNSQNTQNIISSQDKQSDLDLNSQNARIASLACGHPDGSTVDRRPLTVDNCSLTVDNCSEAKECIGRYRTPGDIDIWLHGEREAILEYVRWHVPDCKPVYHHVDFPVVDDVSIEVPFTPTWMNSPIRNRRLQRFFKSMVNSQQSTDGLFNQRDKHTNLDASTHTQACACRPDEGFGLTQKARKAQKIISEQGCQRELDSNSQNLHDASPVRHPDEVLSLTQNSQNNCQGQGQQTTVNGQRTDHPDGIIQHSTFNGNNLTQKAQKAQNARIASLACGHPDGTVDCRPLTVDSNSLTVDSNSLTVDTCLDSKQATFPVPNAAFNRVYILVHIYRHLFAEGIGLRQLLDYYFVLKQGFTESEREETLRILRSLGMMRFTRAVMWVLQEVYAMPDRYLLTSPDAKEGRFLLDEIMLAGNFGKYDERMQRAAGEGTFRWGLRKVLRNFRFVRSYPSEVLWSPIFKVWHLFWRIRHA